MSGLKHVTGEPDRKRSHIGGSTVDIGTGKNAALGVLMALHRREITGEGDRIEAMLFDTATMYLRAFYSDYSLSGNERGRHGHITPGRTPYALLETKTDPVYIEIAQDRLWARFCRLLDREKWIEDDRFATNADRAGNFEELIESMEGVLADQTQEEIVEILEGRSLSANSNRSRWLPPTSTITNAAPSPTFPTPITTVRRRSRPRFRSTSRMAPRRRTRCFRHSANTPDPSWRISVFRRPKWRQSRRTRSSTDRPALLASTGIYNTGV